MCNFNEHVNATTPVDQYSPQGDSPYDCADMSGNVWEWCSTRWWNEKQNEYNYPYNPDDGREDPGGDNIRRVLRGGSWASEGKERVRCARRDWRDGGDWYLYFGFRCCCATASPPGSEF